MNRPARIVWVCASLMLAVWATGCATPSLMSKPKASSTKRSPAKESGRSAKAAAGMPTTDEIPDAHSVGLGVKGS